MVLGDSLSAGYGLQPQESWVDLLTNKLNEDHYAVSVINASVSGATSYDGLNSLPKLLDKYHPNILIIALGSNDGLRGNPVIGMQQNLSKIIQTALAKNIKVLLVGFQIPPNYGDAYAKAFAASFRKLSEEYKVPLVPFLLSGFETDLNYFQKDKLHPTADAQEKILNNVWPYLKPILPKT